MAWLAALLAAVSPAPPQAAAAVEPAVVTVPAYQIESVRVRYTHFAQTVIGYQRKRDGTQLNRQEALDLAHDYDRAASLAKYMIFELEEPYHWPLCSRKIALRNEMAHIKELSSQAALAR